MSDKRPGLLGEIHRRSVWQVVTVYGVGAWFALEVVQGIVDAGNLPDWLPGMALVLLIIGFPMVLATAVIQQGWAARDSSDASPAALLADAPPAGADVDPAVTPPVAAAPPPADSPSLAHQLFTWRNALMGGLLAFGLWGVVATFLLATGRATPGGLTAGAGQAASDLMAIAVLPFDNLSVEEENAFFADGIHEDVLTQLSKVGDLTVISRTSVLPYRDTDLGLSEIASELGVGSILEGSVRRAGDNVRITAQLIDASTDEHIWADNFDRALTTANIFAIQSEIAQRIAEALAATLTPEAEEQITRAPTADLAAYDFYLRARETYQLYTEAGNDEAIRLYQEAIGRDPDYADAWAGLADAYAQRTQRFGFGREWADSAEVAARMALQLEPNLPKGLKALALAHSSRGRISEALDANARAVELNPNYDEAVNNLGVMYFRVGRFDEALDLYKRAYRMSPTTGFSSTNIAFAYVFLGMPAAAEERALEILRLDPFNDSAIQVLRLVDQLRGDYEGALRRARDMVERNPTISRYQLGVAGDAFLLGDFETSLAAVDEALRLTPDTEYNETHDALILRGLALMKTGAEAQGQQVLEARRDVLESRLADEPEAAGLYFEVAAVDAALGDTEAALERAEQAYEAGYRFTLGLDQDAAFESLRGNPQWQALLTRIAEDVAVMRANVQRIEAEAEGAQR
jgi:TolB-like protein/cytochrome c-type biogenesis protein CcmH/NrfG